MDLSTVTWNAALVRLLLAFALGALLGLERERRERPAGLRTHVLVCVASCLAMMSALIIAHGSGESGRIAQGVLAGIGFVGAGRSSATAISCRA